MSTTKRYSHNRKLYVGDNLDVLRGINSESVDLIYFKPPCKSDVDKDTNKAVMKIIKDYYTWDDIDASRHGELADLLQPLYDFVKMTKQSHGKSMSAYLVMVGIQVIEMQRILKQTGSIYFHCDSKISHYVKILMDYIFQNKNYRNDIVFCYDKAGRKTTEYNQNHDTILFYTKSNKYTFNNKLRQSVYWDIPRSKHNQVKDYVRQSPQELIETLIRTSTNKGDVVLLPSIGCATACAVAEKLGRKWTAVDNTPSAPRAVTKLTKSIADIKYPIRTMRQIPRRTDITRLPCYKTHKQKLYGEQNGKCKGCNMNFMFKTITIDHIVPRKKGGDDSIGNLQLLCPTCNSTKGTGTHEQLMATLKRNVSNLIESTQAYSI